MILIGLWYEKCRGNPNTYDHHPQPQHSQASEEQKQTPITFTKFLTCEKEYQTLQALHICKTDTDAPHLYVWSPSHVVRDMRAGEKGDIWLCYFSLFCSNLLNLPATRKSICERCTYTHTHIYIIYILLGSWVSYIYRIA